MTRRIILGTMALAAVLCFACALAAIWTGDRRWAETSFAMGCAVGAGVLALGVVEDVL